jgi:hypothetical protein
MERALQEGWARATARQAALVDSATAAGMRADRITHSRVASQGRQATLARPHFHSCGDAAPGASGQISEAIADADDSEADLLDDDQIEVRFEDKVPPAQPADSPPTEAIMARIGGRFELAGAGTDTFQFHGEVPMVEPYGATASSHVVELVNRLVLEREDAVAECERLRRETRVLRAQLSQCMTEATQAQKTAAKLKAVRSERDRLNAERTMLAREAADLQARLVETQVTLVEVQSELDECRERLWRVREDGQDTLADNGYPQSSLETAETLETEMFPCG